MFNTPRYCVLLTTIVLLFLNSFLYSQPTLIPELQKKSILLQKHKDFEKDTAYINTLYMLAKGFYWLNVESMRFYATKALDLSKKSNYLKGQAESLKQLASSYRLTNDLVPMLQNYQDALTIAEKIKDSSLISRISRNIGDYYISMGRYNEALLILQKANLLVIGNDNKVEIAALISDMGDLYYSCKRYDSAMYYHKKAMQIAIETKDRYTMAFISSGIGKVYFAQGNYREALNYFVPPRKYYIETKDKLGKIHTAILIGKCYQKLNKNDSAIYFAKPALDSAKNEKLKGEIMDASEILMYSYENKNEINEAYKYSKLFNSYSDSVFNEETRKKTFELEAKNIYDRKEDIIKATREKSDLIINHKLRIQRVKIWIGVFLSVAMCIVAVVLYFNNVNKNRLNILLKEKNKEINRQKAEIELQAKELSINNSFKDKLFSIVSHDLRSPLNSLTGVLTLLQLKKLPQETIEKMLTGLLRDVNNTTELVNTLFSWANNQMKGFEVRPENIKINEIITNIFELLITRTTEKQLIISSLVSPDTLVYADNNMVQIIIRNLVSNAIKFCNPGDSISIDAKIKGEKVEFCVFDTGIGIKEDVLQKILNQESVTTFGTQREKGTGLGLLLCKEFIEKNAGDFWVESEIGKGSYFYFTLPKALV